MSGRLANKRCLIVGGTGGIGLASARRFVEEGARVLVTGLLESEAPSLLDVPFRACDATRPEAVVETIDWAENELGGLDVLFHVAGISGRRLGDGPLHECTDEGWHQTILSNLTSVFLTNRAALRVFLKAGQGGVILNMASVLALDPAPRHFNTAAYTASKAAILGLTRLAAASYAPNRIRVNALAPGLIDTPMATRAVQNPAIQDYLHAKQPLCAGPGAARDCAEAAVFLCGEESRLITGTVLAVDGGWQLCDPAS